MQEEDKGPHWKRNWAAFWFLGMINNFFYCIVLDAADQIAERFNLKSYIALVGWANIFFGLFAKLINAFVLTRTSYNKRMVASSMFALVGLVVTALSPFMGTSDVFRFTLALGGITCIGINSAYGESVVLGYLEGFHPKLVGAWSSGTGMSGVAAALLYILFSRIFHFSNTGTFFAMSPWIAVYAAMYFVVVKVPLRSGDLKRGAGGAITSSSTVSVRELRTAQRFEDTDQGEGTAAANPSDGIATAAGKETSALLDGTTATSAPTAQDVIGYGSNLKYTSWRPIPDPLGAGGPMDGSPTESVGLCARMSAWKVARFPAIKRIHSMILGNNIHLMLVYIFEYAAQFMVPFAIPCVAQLHSTKFLVKNAYLLSQFAYQTGVLCSRSSLMCIRIRRVWILSLLQFVNAIGWFCQAKFMYLSSHYDGLPKDYAGSKAETSEQWFVALLLAWMFFVGLLGGAAYVNVFYNILQMDALKVPDAPSPTASPILNTTANPADAMVHKPPSYLVQHRGGEGAEGTGEGEDPAPLTPNTEQAVAKVKQDRELAMNIGAIYAVIGITLGSLVDVVFSNTMLTGSCN